MAGLWGSILKRAQRTREGPLVAIAFETVNLGAESFRRLGTGSIRRSRCCDVLGARLEAV